MVLVLAWVCIPSSFDSHFEKSATWVDCLERQREPRARGPSKPFVLDMALDRSDTFRMYHRYVVEKFNEKINCYQGILVTLGTKMLGNKLDSIDHTEAQTIFSNLNIVLPTPLGFEKEAMKSSVSWLKSNSTSYKACINEMNRAAIILKKLGYEILLLETNKLEGILYEDEVQILTEANKNKFRISSAPNILP